jgi:hypothetical protein
VLEENPGMKAADVLKEIAVRWKNLTSDEKTVYEKDAKDDKERYIWYCIGIRMTLWFP